ncbi:MAG TPA: biotin carboxylase N-terminal domain-containing protein [Stellaceae bacterium]|nr:biotin carboxylase N-terminal domain-containing protein [Stellaceae bacterium]
MFHKLLIANRGEIACRIIRTARSLGIGTVAVYSTADAAALHVEMTDEAYCIGPPPARESYLAIPNILEAARKSRADSVHPGYGFLAENADFAAACEAAGIAFIGPPSAAIRAMGDKAQAKALMEKAGVPLVPGYHGAEQGEKRLAEEARRLGYPVLIKASAGGGGRGMRVIEAASGFASGLSAARREALSSFGAGRVILEKYLLQPRHIEVQIFADRGGNTIHLFERECSIQRRYQKILEEAPAPGLEEERRHAMAEAAVAAARAVGYVGAGTVEFIVDGAAFYFIEMNTRLQVEHPVTEMITGLDLVEWQLRVAAGEKLPRNQAGVRCDGHAIEARLYAEDPARDFLPATGTLLRLNLPVPERELRIETGVRQGDAVTVHYDPLLAKLVAWGENRAAALRRLIAALGETRVLGVATNRDFLLRLLAHPDFAAGAIDTGFIPRHRASLLPPPAEAPFAVLAAAALALVGEEEAAAKQAARRSGDPYSPWQKRDGWRSDGTAAQIIRLRDLGKERAVRIAPDASGFRLEIDGRSAEARVRSAAPGEFAMDLDGVSQTASVVRRGNDITIVLGPETHRLVHLNALAPVAETEAATGRLTAPMPGKILLVLAASGAAVKRGEVLMVLEAMKMEHAISAPADGIVEAVHYAAGDLVEEGALLLAFTAAA